MTIAMTVMRTATLPAMALLAAGLVARANEAQRPERVAVPRPAVLACFDVGAIGELTFGPDDTLHMRGDCPDWVRQATLRRLWKLLPPAEVPKNSAI